MTTKFNIDLWSYDQRVEVSNAVDIMADFQADMAEEDDDEDMAEETVRLRILAAALRSAVDGDDVEVFIALDGLGDALMGAINQSLENAEEDPDIVMGQPWYRVLANTLDLIDIDPVEARTV